MKNYSQTELCELVLAIEDFYKEDGRAAIKYGLTRMSRPEVFRKVYQEFIPKEDLKLYSTFSTQCASCIKQGAKFQLSLQPLPKVLQMIYIFGHHEKSKLEGFLDWLEGYQGGKFEPLIEMSKDNEVARIASNADLYSTMQLLLERVDYLTDLAAKEKEYRARVEKLERENRMLNKYFRQLLTAAHKDGNPEIIKAFNRWEKDFQD